MLLTDKERAMWAGDEGPALRKAMQIVVALGEIYGAQRLVPVASVQVAGVSFKNLGEAGLQFLAEWAAQGAHVRVPSFMNPAGMDLQRWREMGISPEFAWQQQRVVDALLAMGVQSTCTCTPYLVGHVPQHGQHLAWSESSAVSYANSVLGARSNREGGPSALAAAMTGLTADYGLHLDEKRSPTHVVEVRCALRNEADYGALGYWIGKHLNDGVPYLRLSDRLSGLPHPECWMALGAAMAASGAVALYHVEGVTPEAAQYASKQPLTAMTGAEGEGTPEVVTTNLPVLRVDSLQDAYAALDSPLTGIDFVSLGCPHATLADIARVADLLTGQRVRATLWITTSRGVRERAAQAGLVARIEAAGGKVYADTCLVVAPVEELGFHAMATNSAKAAFYAPSHSGLQRRFGTLEQCVAAAISGRWDDSRAGGSIRHFERSEESRLCTTRARTEHAFLRFSQDDSEDSQDEKVKSQDNAVSTAQIGMQDRATGRRSTKCLCGRAIFRGQTCGLALVSSMPIGFLGGVNPETGVVEEEGHPLQGQCIAGRVLVFPMGKGSTVGSYTLYRLARAGLAPAGIINARSEAIVAVGAIISEIPMVDLVDITQIAHDNAVTMDGDSVIVEE